VIVDTLTRRAGLSSGGLPNKTGNEEEKSKPPVTEVGVGY
jgi:hypothetical protein